MEQLTEQDQLPPVNTNYLVNIVRGSHVQSELGDRQPKWYVHM